MTKVSLHVNNVEFCRLQGLLNLQADPRSALIAAAASGLLSSL